MDKLTPEQRSRNMSRIRSRDTKPEKTVRSLLHRMGYRFRINRKDLPGKPDIVLPKHKTIIFVHGCFWHRHEGCKYSTIPKSNTEFWLNKFNDNVQRDKVVQIELRKLGWKVVVIWQCELKDLEALKGYLKNLLS
jgi:DNA mismatch endonuclease (patch repair protein)